jgi:hypothetical protein
MAPVTGPAWTLVESATSLELSQKLSHTSRCAPPARRLLRVTIRFPSGRQVATCVGAQSTHQVGRGEPVVIVHYFHQQRRCLTSP